MKKYLLGAFAVVLAVGFSAFTSVEVPKAEKQASYYLFYVSGAQNQIGSYTQQVAIPNCPGAVVLCAIRVQDTNNDGIIQQSELTAVFNTLDTDADGTLNDQTESAVLLKKS